MVLQIKRFANPEALQVIVGSRPKPFEEETCSCTQRRSSTS
ncbi:hypothetical protein TIFTF001_041993 [Ficus carica]|uniref:Uncharacterized protein n=1 Tax=Ficus carica TaxID=3494 RepID=A0AA88DCW8_FICCA|nr:hypothetical protein TIFTF001_041991 [Ficus carica]GMN34039.1 hypothetical protein TIFTF001_041993 [Ficus carica]